MSCLVDLQYDTTPYERFVPQTPHLLSSFECLFSIGFGNSAFFDLIDGVTNCLVWKLLPSFSVVQSKQSNACQGLLVAFDIPLIYVKFVEPQLGQLSGIVMPSGIVVGLLTNCSLFSVLISLDTLSKIDLICSTSSSISFISFVLIVKIAPFAVIDKLYFAISSERNDLIPFFLIGYIIFFISLSLFSSHS